jgi:hypothetical protein
MRRSIPFSAFWLRSSVVSVLISLVSDTRLTEPHDINLISLGCGSSGSLLSEPASVALVLHFIHGRRIPPLRGPR